MTFQITNFNFANKNITLSFPNNTINNHTFTIITGRNGIGKSRLLVSLVSSFLSNQVKLDSILNKNTVEKVIAVSNIRNDKFPRKRGKSDKYHYIGSKLTPPLQYNDRFSVFKNLLCNKHLNNDSVCQAFSYLGFEPAIILEFQPIKSSYLDKYNQIKNYLEYYEAYYEHFNSKIISFDFKEKLNTTFNIILDYKKEIYDNFLDIRNVNINENYIEHNIPQKKRLERLNFSEKLYQDLKRSLDENELFFLECISKLSSLNIDINYDLFEKLAVIILENKILWRLEKIKFDLRINSNSKLLEDSIFLLENDLLKITNVSLTGDTFTDAIRFFDLSSGQQSLFNILLGISSVIEDNSLICIDEPEVNLHPEWQNEFIIKLQNIFDHITGCHFIIATHSPQIVAGLTSKNGFVVDLENNITHTASDYSKKSADYQLAHIFGYPGYNNEYLIRIALTLLSKITKQVEFNHSDIDNLNILNSSKKDLPENDPVSFLIEQINALV